MSDYEKLLEGNRVFLKKNKDFVNLGLGSRPKHIVVACSDSRVAPEIILNARLGELFVIRSAGEVMDDAGLATIEYGAVHLGVKSIIMLAHTDCGAVSEAMNFFIKGYDGKPIFYKEGIKSKMDMMAYSIYRNVAANKSNARDLRSAAFANLRAQTKVVERYEPIHNSVKKGLKIISGMYDVSTGKVELYV